MLVNFIKATGIGNDYIFINTLDQPELTQKIIPYIPKLSDRNFGVGGDGVIFLEPSACADCSMRMFNADGREGGMCGNGIRSLAKILWDKNIIKKNPLSINTGNGVLEISMEFDQNQKMSMALVGMGTLDFDPKNIPFCSPDKKKIDGVSVFTYLYNDQELLFYVGGIGSKHATCFLNEDVTSFDFCTIGNLIEQDKSLFPEGVNVEFVNIISPTQAIMRVWERGSGHTLACGTGATFVAGVGMHLGKFDPSGIVEIILERGSLFISQKDDGTMMMKGEADLVFEGTIDLSAL